MSKIKIALDGPGGAGKSSVAKAVAKQLGIFYVDTGAMYRTVGLYMKEHGISPEDTEAVVSALPGVTLSVSLVDGKQLLCLDGKEVGDEIRTPEISMYASRVSAIPEVRAFLLDTQRRLADEQSVIMDGRDIGTVIFPDADVKIFLTASPEARAKRRYAELIAKGTAVTYEDVLSEMNERDRNDSSRAIAPLRPADDAILLDTSNLDFNGSVAAVTEIISRKTAPAPRMSRFYRVLHALAGWLIRFLFRIRISGKENVPKQGGYVVCANHVALVDVFTLGASFPRQLRFLAKSELFRIPILAPLIRSLGAVPVKRGSGDVKAIRSSVEILNQGSLFSIFPQGHRYPGVDPADTPIKNGVGLIAYRAQAGIIPVCIKMKKQKYCLFRRTEVLIGKPITVGELGLHEGGSEAYARASEIAFRELCKLGGFSRSDTSENNR